MRVAAIQYAPVFMDVSANLKRLAKLVLQAAKQGAQLIVLPELCTTGYSLMGAKDAATVAEFVGKGETCRVFQALSRKLDVAIAWGMVEQELACFYNTQVLVYRDDIVKVQKLNLWGNDFLWAKPGRGSPPIYTYRDKKVGLLVCRDIRDKSAKISSFYEKGDADIIAFSSNWGRGGFPAVAWMDFVEENRAALVVSNRYGTEQHNDFGPGGSCIISNAGQVNVDGLVWSSDCIVLGDVASS